MSNLSIGCIYTQEDNKSLDGETYFYLILDKFTSFDFDSSYVCLVWSLEKPYVIKHTHLHLPSSDTNMQEMTDYSLVPYWLRLVVNLEKKCWIPSYGCGSTKRQEAREKKEWWQDED